jgi:hypothetical protein
VAALPGPELAFGHRRAAAFRVCGVTGLALAAPAGILLARHAGADIGVMAAVVVASVLAFLAIAAATQLTRGGERLIYYHHQAAVLGVAALVPAVLGEPVLPYLDAAAVGLGIFLACGRVGCLLAGCCHGRPARTGVLYTRAHAAEGFPAYLVGVPLVPVQAVEAVATAAIAGAAGAAILSGARPGTALALYLSAYAVLRFGLERLRGDAARPQLGGLSEAQWTSLAIAAVVPAAGAAGLIPATPVHTLVAVGLAVAAVALAATRSRRRRLLEPRHVAEVAAALQRGGVAETSLGLRISCGAIDGTAHYTLSARGEPLDAGEVARLATLLCRLRHPRQVADVVHGRSGAVHVVVPTAAAPGPQGPSPGRTPRPA